MKATPGAGETAPQENSTGATTNRDYVESTTGNNTQTDFQSQERRKSGQRDKPLAETPECDPEQTGKFQQRLKHLRDIQNSRGQFMTPRSALVETAADIQRLMPRLTKISKLISGTIKNGINEVERIQRETNEKTKRATTRSSLMRCF